MHILVQTQVLGITPEGRLGQPLLPDNQRHDPEPGKVWLLKPFRPRARAYRVREPGRHRAASKLVLPVPVLLVSPHKTRLR